jgi:hypothetical protein
MPLPRVTRVQPPDLPPATLVGVHVADATAPVAKGNAACRCDFFRRPVGKKDLAPSIGDQHAIGRQIQGRAADGTGLALGRQQGLEPECHCNVAAHAIKRRAVLLGEARRFRLTVQAQADHGGAIEQNRR